MKPGTRALVGIACCSLAVALQIAGLIHNAVEQVLHDAGHRRHARPADAVIGRHALQALVDVPVPALLGLAAALGAINRLARALASLLGRALGRLLGHRHRRLCAAEAPGWPFGPG